MSMARPDPVEALRSATLNPGQVSWLDKTMGPIEQGKIGLEPGAREADPLAVLETPHKNQSG